MKNNSKSLVKLENVSVDFSISNSLFADGKKKLRVVDEVSLEIYKGKILGLVGESGSGKTTLGRASIRLIPIAAGKVFFNGIELEKLRKEELRIMRRQMQIVFQDPNSSLDPRMKIKDLIGNPLLVHRIAKNNELKDRTAKIMERVGLSPDEMHKYPHQFSGGQKQRISIARALILEPEYIVLDEPVSALDLSIQAQIINLVLDLRKELELTYLFISHDIGVVSHVSDRVAVMYFGRIMEIGENVFEDPKHPYTMMLIESLPGKKIKPVGKPPRGEPPRGEPPRGEPPSIFESRSGCVFYSRCPIGDEECKKIVPQLKNGVACLKKNGC